MNGLSPNVLVVDRDPGVCRLIEDALAIHRVSCRSVHDGRDARRLLQAGRFDVVVLDLPLPGENGPDLVKFISEHQPGARTVCTNGTGSTEAARPVPKAGARDPLHKPFEVFPLADAILRLAGDQSLASGLVAGRTVPGENGRAAPDCLAVAALENFSNYRGALLSGTTAQSASEAKKMLLELAGALVVAVEAKDHYTRRHSEHVAFYGENIARHAGLAADLQETVRVAGLLHDIGKIAVPDSVLTKPGRLDPMELALVRQHPVVGAGILGNVSLMASEARLVRQHHENWDGSGYPDGLSGSSILPAARILNIADSMDAMLMHRAYKPGYRIPQMLAELRRCAGTQFDPELARVAEKWCEQNPARLILPQATVQPGVA